MADRKDFPTLLTIVAPGMTFVSARSLLSSSSSEPGTSSWKSSNNFLPHRYRLFSYEIEKLECLTHACPSYANLSFRNRGLCGGKYCLEYLVDKEW